MEHMRDSQILSSFSPTQAPPPVGPPAPAAPVLLFDVCQIGVVLRAVLLGESCAGVGVAFSSAGFLDWGMRLALVTGGVLPATLAWLLMACGAKRLLARLSPAWQCAWVIVLGALAGVYGCAVLAVVGLLEPPPWVASASAGVLLSSLLVAMLVMRAKGQMPADTAARLEELQARIRPHFLFNTLNSAIALVRAEPDRAETLLEDLSDLFRRALQDTGEPVSLAEEINLAQRYLAIEQVRFGERLRVQWSLDPAAHAARLPPLLLQPLVENAVRHGVEPSPSGADVRISTQCKGSIVLIKVTNSVPAGFGVRSGQGIALHNVRARLGLLHDVQGQFRCGFKNGVYQVRIEVPLP